jgi:hypothetical protein
MKLWHESMNRICQKENYDTGPRVALRYTRRSIQELLLVYAQGAHMLYTDLQAIQS